MGVVVQPVPERVLRQSVKDGAAVKRVVLERIKVDPPLVPELAPKRPPRVKGEWRILIFLNGHTDGITPSLYRGGVRTFSTLEKVEDFGRKLMPKVSVESYDVFLRRITEDAVVNPAPEDGEPDSPDTPNSHLRAA